MTNRLVVSVAAVVAIGGAAGCSSGTASVKRRPATLPPGTAQVTINGKDVGTTGAVHCAPDEGLTTIKTGDDASGATVMVSNAAKLKVEFVRIRNLNGFSGDYNVDLEDNAAVALIASTYDIRGAALGYGPTSFVPTKESFTIKVAC